MLRRESGSTVEKTGTKAPTRVGRPSDIWRIIDAEALAAKLAADAADVDVGENGPAEYDQLDRTLTFAEDQLVLALHATERIDVDTYASSSLTALDRHADEATPAKVDRSRPLGEPRNLPLAIGRAEIVRSVAKYLLAHDDEGFAGALWRSAFDAVASFDSPDQDALHKFLLTQLVQTAYDRTSYLTMLPRATLADAVFRDVHAGDDGFNALLQRVRTDSAVVREAVRLALIDLIADLAEGHRSFDSRGAARLFDAVAKLSGAGNELSSEERDQLVGHLTALAASDDAATAIGARQLLLVLREPRRRRFWRELAHAAAVPVDITTLFIGLAQSDLEEAFSFLVERLDAGDVAPVHEAILEWLEHLEASMVDAAQETFADFLVAVVDDGLRVNLASLPERIGLHWPLTRFEDRLVHQFFTKLSKWKVLVHAGSDAGRSRDALAHDITQLAGRIMPVLDEEDERRACNALTAELHHPAGAALAVDILLTLRRDKTLAEAVVSAKATEDNVWSDVVDWYAARREALAPSDRTRLVKAIYEALPGDQDRSFLMGLSGVVEGGAPEVSDGPFDPELRLWAEVYVSNSYEHSAETLPEFAAEPDFMDAVPL